MVKINKRTVKFSKKYKNEYRKAKRQGRNTNLLKEIIILLANDEPLPQANKDHPMKGIWKGYRNCHIENDWVLIYKKTDNNELILHLTRIGSHSDLNITQ